MTIKIDRAQLAQVFKDHQTLRAFEQALEDVSTTIPNNISDMQALATDASLSAASAKSGVARLDALITALEAFVNTQRTASATINRLEARIADLETQLMGMRSIRIEVQQQIETQFTALSRSINMDGLRRQIDDIQTLVQAS